MYYITLFLASGKMTLIPAFSTYVTELRFTPATNVKTISN